MQFENTISELVKQNQLLMDMVQQMQNEILTQKKMVAEILESQSTIQNDVHYIKSIYTKPKKETKAKVDDIEKRERLEKLKKHLLKR